MVKNATAEIGQRRRDVAARLPELKADALLVSAPANVRYLSGYTGSNGLILLLASEAHFFTDPRYEISARQNIAGHVHIVKGPLIAGVIQVIKRKRLKKIGFESGWTQYDAYQRLKEDLPLGVSLVPVGRIIEERRMVKSPAEIDTIRRSVNLNSEAFARVLKRIRPGVRELDVAAEVEFQMKMLGAEKPSFDTIVAAGPHSALPHSHPTAHQVGNHELLLIDMGASLEGYASDMTRVVHLGSPSKKIREMYRAVLEAQLAGIEAVREGTTAGKVDTATRRVLKKHKLDKAFVHSTGHGLGLEIHEPPRLGKKDKTRLQAGMAITIEPGVYIEGLAGIRIEDTVLVTKNGCEVLTPTSKEFVQL
ncbi:MAG: Xaa-Pro peptidase family protein [Acidobacteriota bacterium]